MCFILDKNILDFVRLNAIILLHFLVICTNDFDKRGSETVKSDALPQWSVWVYLFFVE